MSDCAVPRRQFLATGAAAIAGAMMPTSATGQPPEPPAPPPTSFSLGIASYSLRNFPRDRAVQMIKALDTRFVNWKSVHLPFDLSPEQLTTARREIAAAGLVTVGGGVITFDRDNDADVEQYFAYAKAAGMPLITAHAAATTLPRIERFATRYDIKVAIHNHGPEDKNFPSPYDALKHIQDMDPRMGLCIDVGHTVRTGTDVVRAVADAGPRLFDIHMKDLRSLSEKGSQCIVGEGAIPIPEIFRQLEAVRFAGYVNLEYEIDADNPLPGMQQSFAYMRGALAGLAAGGHPTHP